MFIKVFYLSNKRYIRGVLFPAKKRLQIITASCFSAIQFVNVLFWEFIRWHLLFFLGLQTGIMTGFLSATFVNRPPIRKIPLWSNTGWSFTRELFLLRARFLWYIWFLLEMRHFGPLEWCLSLSQNIGQHLLLCCKNAILCMVLFHPTIWRHVSGTQCLKPNYSMLSTR